MNTEQFKSSAKPISIRGGNAAFDGRVMAGGQASPLPISPTARIGGGAGQNSFMPAPGGAEVKLAGSGAPASFATAPPSVQPQAAPQAQRFQPAIRQEVPQRPTPPAAPSPSMGRGPFLKEDAGQPSANGGERVYRVTMSGRTPDGQLWDSQHDAAFPSNVQLDGAPVIERIQ